MRSHRVRPSWRPRRYRSRLTLAVMLAAAGSLILASATLAAGPSHLHETITESGPNPFIDCDGFTILESDVTIQRNRVIWYDDSGAETREHRQVHFDFTLTNSVTGLEADYMGHFHIFIDWPSETFVLTGALRQLWIDGRKVWSSSGRNFFSPDTGDLFTGSLPLTVWEEGLCDVMA